MLVNTIVQGKRLKEKRVKVMLGNLSFEDRTGCLVPGLGKEQIV